MLSLQLLSSNPVTTVVWREGQLCTIKKKNLEPVSLPGRLNSWAKSLNFLLNVQFQHPTQNMLVSAKHFVSSQPGLRTSFALPREAKVNG